jgi:archaeosortase B (VPXXXP-CTERM-specific)
MALRFAGFWLAGFLAYGLLDRRLEVLNTVTARSLGFVLDLLGFETRVAGDQVAWGSHAGFTIIDECTGIFGVLAFSALVLATPASPARRLVGIAGGIAAVAALNLGRLVLLALILTYAPAAFPTAHEFVMQVVFMAAVGGLFLAWVPRSPRARA